MVRKVMIGAVVAAVMTLGSIPAASAATTYSLLLPQATAFSMLGHSCGGIQEQAFTTGFDPTSGYPTGAVYVQTRCGGSGRGGGYHTTTYSAWAAATWDFTGTVVSSSTLATAPAVDPAFSAFDASGNEVFNQLSAVNVLPENCTVGNTTYCTYRASLTLDPAFVAPPRVTGLTLSSGPAAGGTSVTITGTGFTGATAVNFGATPATSYTVDSDTSITAVSPAGSSGTVDVTVTTAGGTSASSASDQFTFFAQPTVTGVSPASGPVTGWTPVTITGTGFTGATSVRFGGTQWYDFTVDSDTSITATSPPAEAADTVHVTVTTLGGTSTTSSADRFTYTPGPACGTVCVSVGDTTMLEGDTGTRKMTFAVTLSQPQTSAVTVQYDVASLTATGGPAAGTGVDFQTGSGTLKFTPSAKTGLTPVAQTVSVPVYGDTAIEADETFNVTLSNPSGANLGRSTATATIVNDDPSTGVTLGVGDASIAPATSGKQTLKLPVTLSAAASGTTAVAYTITPATAAYSKKAAGGGAYGGKTSGTVSFAAGSTLKTINVPIWPSAGSSTDQTFTVTLSGLSGNGVTLLRDTGTGTILANQ